MSYENDDIIAALRAARQGKQLSQRELSAKAGVPQSHISKIENGGSDIRLSSLIELARALELELMLVPRRLVPAVQGILRSAPLQVPGPHETYREITDALKVLGRLALGYPWVRAIEKSQQLVRELGNFRLNPVDLARIKSEVAKLSGVKVPTDNDLIVIGAVKNLSNMRNQLAHAAIAAPKPVYSLEDDDDA